MSSFKSSVKPAAAAVAQEMSNDDATTIEVIATIAYPEISTPNEQSGKFQALLLVKDQESIDGLVSIRDKSHREKFPNAKGYDSSFHDPIRDANEMTGAGEYAFRNKEFRVEGAVVIRPKTGFAPTCVWGPNQAPIDASEIHGGDEVVCEISAYSYSNQSRGTAFSLGKIWLIRKGTVRIERGAGGASNVKRIDTSRLKFDIGGGGEEA
jgi:hypothetical protein